MIKNRAELINSRAKIAFITCSATKLSLNVAKLSLRTRVQKYNTTQKHRANESKAELVLALPSAADVHEINIVQVMRRDKLV